MKTLILMRHAHPEYNSDNGDVNRKLTDEGRKAAADMAQYLLRNSFIPQAVITSHARRARETTDIVSQNLNIGKTDVSTLEMIYYGYTTDELTSHIATTDDNVATLMIIGHNPDISYFAANMTSLHNFSFPPAGVVVITFDIDKWSDIEPRQGTIISSNSPRNRG